MSCQCVRGMQDIEVRFTTTKVALLCSVLSRAPGLTHSLPGRPESTSICTSNIKTADDDDDDDDDGDGDGDGDDDGDDGGDDGGDDDDGCGDDGDNYHNVDDVS